MEHIHPKKSLGQNFLTDPRYLAKIADAAAIGPEDKVLEIGPGRGHLTRFLAERAGYVVALELDERLVPLLVREFSAMSNVRIVQADALNYAYESLSGTWAVVANLPYYISTPIIQRLIAHRRTFSRLTLMLQKEVAHRIASPPGSREYGYLSVLVQLYAVPQIEFTVPAGAFSPKPKVDSAVITLSIRERPAAELKDEACFMRIIRAAFSQRRKTLRNALKQLGTPGETMHTLQVGSGVDLGRRAETLSVEEFGRLANSFHDASPSPEKGPESE